MLLFVGLAPSQREQHRASSTDDSTTSPATQETAAEPAPGASAPAAEGVPLAVPPAPPPADPPAQPPAPAAPPPAPTPPPPVPRAKPVIPSSAPAYIEMGGAALSTVLAATPAAPLAPFVAALARVLAGWALDNDKATHAQPNLLLTRDLALREAYYQGYMSEWALANALYEAGIYDEVQKHVDAADAVGARARADVARKLDELEVGSYRRWMAGTSAGKADGRLWRGYLLGDAGITGQPRTSDFQGGTPGGWVYRHESDGVWRRYHWDPSHPDYEGTALPPASERTVELVRKATEERIARAAYEEDTGLGEGGYVNEIKFGNGRAVDYDNGWEPPAVKPKAPATTTPPVVETPPAPTPPVPAPTPPVVATPPTPKLPFIPTTLPVPAPAPAPATKSTVFGIPTKLPLPGSGSR